MTSISVPMKTPQNDLSLLDVALPWVYRAFLQIFALILEHEEDSRIHFKQEEFTKHQDWRRKYCKERNYELDCCSDDIRNGYRQRKQY